MAWELPRVQTVYRCNLQFVQVVQKTIIVQIAYTSVMEQSPLKWNGRDCDS